ncbi:GTP-sensing transcriptional pleiotropic repressor CodY [Frankliniella fusca]|uniref:GTP-sensing transcriptional pleiotropic repressor CodY n=1 Tax=Frankliniella fusca TaxID=407009 RepID=A0AAE1HXR3_9NEOP|nr:GTP-sensing transcriptional pleiotropic repressor CodY [Frankliniella fusca]
MDFKLDQLISYLLLMSPKRIVLNAVQDDVIFGNGSLLHRRLLSALVMLAIHFNEDQSRLIKCVEDTTLPHEIFDVLPPNTPPTPLIVALGNTPYLATNFFLVMDGVCVCSNLRNGLEAAMALCAAYFVFGVLYPSDASTSLTFMER